MWEMFNEVLSLRKTPKMKRRLNRIKEVLEEQGRSQTWLAKKLGKARQAVNGICNNHHQPSLNLLYEIAEILDVKPSELLGDGKLMGEN